MRRLVAPSRLIVLFAWAPSVDSVVPHHGRDAGVAGVLLRSETSETKSSKVSNDRAGGNMSLELKALYAENERARDGSHTTYIAGVPVYNMYKASDTDSWLLKFPPGFDNAKLESICQEVQCTTMGHPSEGGASIICIYSTTENLTRILQNHPEVEYAEHDDLVEPIPEINDHLYAADETDSNVLSWGLDRIDDRVGQDNSYDLTGQDGAGVHVYVLDTGIRITHDDFEGRAIAAFDCTTGAANCTGSGLGNPDGNGHGTHCAGTVAGKRYGVAKGARVYAGKVLTFLQSAGGWSGYVSWIVAGIDWVIARGQKPAVINLSLGGRGTSRIYQDVIDNAQRAGVVVVVAAGNSKDDACEFRPAYVPSAITVGSTDKNDKRSSFSNYGSCVDIFAPGGSIPSASSDNDVDHVIKSGTSMACPHVAGAAAVIIGREPHLTAQQVSEKLMNTASTGYISDLRGSPNKLLYVTKVPAHFRTQAASVDSVAKGTQGGWVKGAGSSEFTIHKCENNLQCNFNGCSSDRRFAECHNSNCFARRVTDPYTCNGQPDGTPVPPDEFCLRQSPTKLCPPRECTDVDGALSNATCSALLADDPTFCENKSLQIMIFVFCRYTCKICSKAMCDKAVCPAGMRLKPVANTTECADISCDTKFPSSPDTHTCCEVTSACAASYGASVGYPVCCGQEGAVPSDDLICGINSPVCTGFVKGTKYGECQDMSSEKTEGACTASYGAKVGSPVCCGQNSTVSSADHICPEDLPHCVGYIQGSRWGSCQDKGGSLACSRGYKCFQGKAVKDQWNGKFLVTVLVVLMFIVGFGSLYSLSDKKGDADSRTGEEGAGGSETKLEQPPELDDGIENQEEEQPARLDADAEAVVATESQLLRSL